MKITIKNNFKLYVDGKCVDINDEINTDILTIEFIDEYYIENTKYENPLEYIENKTLDNCKSEIDKDITPFSMKNGTVKMSLIIKANNMIKKSKMVLLFQTTSSCFPKSSRRK
jgi:hypothetical protein